jgi:hypothetical protein
MNEQIAAFERALDIRKARTQERIDNLSAQRLAHAAAIPEWVRTMRSVEDEVAHEQRVMRDCTSKDNTPMAVLLQRAAQLEWLIQTARMRQQAVEHLRMLGDRSVMERFEKHTAAIQKIEDEIKRLKENTAGKEFKRLKQAYEQAKKELIDYMAANTATSR